MARHLKVLMGKRLSRAALGVALAKGLPKSLSPKIDFVCACEPQFRSVCEDLPFYGAHEGCSTASFTSPGQQKEQIRGSTVSSKESWRIETFGSAARTFLDLSTLSPAYSTQDDEDPTYADNNRLPFPKHWSAVL